MKTWLYPSLLLVLLSACPQAPAPPVVVVRPETRVLDAATRQTLEIVQSDGTLVFGGPTALQAGNVLVAEPTATAPNGLLRKVTGLEQVGGKTLVRTTEAQMGDAIQQGKLNVEQELTSTDLRSVVPAPGVQLGSIRPQAEEGFTIPINLVVLDKDGNANTTNDRIVASGELSLKVVFGIDLDLDCGFLCIYDNDLDFLAKIGIKETAKLKIAGDALLGINLKKTVPIVTLNFGTKTFFIGPVPVVITPRIVIELKFDGSVGIKVSYEASQTLTAVAGVKYDDGWKNISELDNSFQSGPVSADSSIAGALKAKAKAAVRGELMLYGVVGPTIEIAPFVGLDLMYPRDPFWKLEAGIEGNVGVNIKILGYSKSYSTNLWDNSIEIARSSNTAPVVKFLNPDAGNVDVNICCSLRVQVNDPEDGTACCLVSFKSSNTADGVNGVLGNASGVQPELAYTFTSLGSRTITATVVDSKGATSSTTRSINAVNTPPTVAISAPFGGQEFYQGVAYTLRGTSYDINESNFEVPCTSLTWTTNAGADGQKTGCNTPITFASTGPRTLTLKATDAFGATGTATANITVLPAPANLPPVVNLTSPQNNINIGPDSVIQLAGTATDPEGGVVTLSWDVTGGYNPAAGTGETPKVITLPANGNWKPTDSFTYTSCEVSDTLRLRLKARDPQNVEGSDFVVIRVIRIC
jgi:hypothetical protein